MDAILFLFSFTDHGSFEDLSNQISRVTDPSDRIVKLVVGTKYPFSNVELYAFKQMCKCDGLGSASKETIF